jgi:hypothetical protein
VARAGLRAGPLERRAKRRPLQRWREYKPPVQSSVAMGLSGLKLRKWKAQRAGDQPAQLEAIGVLRQRPRAQRSPIL